MHRNPFRSLALLIALLCPALLAGCASTGNNTGAFRGATIEDTPARTYNLHDADGGRLARAHVALLDALPAPRTATPSTQLVLAFALEGDELNRVHFDPHAVRVQDPLNGTVAPASVQQVETGDPARLRYDVFVTLPCPLSRLRNVPVHWYYTADGYKHHLQAMFYREPAVRYMPYRTGPRWGAPAPRWRWRFHPHFHYHYWH